MARARSDLPRMQKQSPTRAPLERAVALPQVIEKPTQSRKPPMMRQYDLIERVRRYNPKTNEALLNRAEIDSLFGPDIGTLVDGLTKLKKLDLVTKEAKQAENLRKLLLAIAADVRVLLIKLADRLHNMRTLDYMPVEARRRAAEETLEIYAPLAGRMGMHAMREELDDLAFRELYPEACEVVSGRLNALADRHKHLITEIEQQLTKKLPARGMEARVLGRRKRPYSTWRKMERKSVGFEQLSDIFGFRVIVKTVAA